MQEAALAQAADQLYGLPPASFREARDERAAQARTAGDRELAAAIRKLRRPTVSAWLVNKLVREAGDQVDELLELGEALREAQAGLAGDRLRELSGRRRQLVPALSREARRLAQQAGQPVSDQTERELTATLDAALADPAAAAAVRTGRLASALSYAGLGAPDLEEAVAVPGVMPAQPAGGRPGAGQRGRQPGAAQRGPAGRRAQPGRPERDRARRAETAGAVTAGEARARDREARAAEREARAAEAARRDLTEAQAAARAAEDALAEAERQVAAATGQHQAAQQRIAELEQQLDAAQADQARAARAAGDARQQRHAAARSLATAQRRLARAQERASHPG